MPALPNQAKRRAQVDCQVVVKQIVRRSDIVPERRIPQH